MKKLTVLLILALCLSLASCVATKIDEEKLDDIKNETESTETVTPDEIPEMPELPWADGPVETPMIPPQFIEDDTPVTPEDVTTPSAEPETPAETEGPELDEKELPILQIVPEENETPAIPIN